MTNLHIIIGDSNARKSSMLRCLTGVGGGAAKKDMDVKLHNGNIIVVHCTMSALQESYKPKMPAEFITYIQSLSPVPTEIAFTLRVSQAGKYPSYAAYIQAFSQIGWQISNVALLGNSACSIQCLPISANVIRVPNSSINPTNESAAHVRQAWGWL